MNKKNDYRKIYKEQIGKIPTGFIIHHIDHNHNNNSPMNLVAIPKRLHVQYHNAYAELKKYDPRRMISYKESFIPLLRKFEKYFINIINYANERPEDVIYGC